MIAGEEMKLNFATGFGAISKYFQCILLVILLGVASHHLSRFTDANNFVRNLIIIRDGSHMGGECRREGNPRLKEPSFLRFWDCPGCTNTNTFLFPFDGFHFLLIVGYVEFHIGGGGIEAEISLNRGGGFRIEFNVHGLIDSCSM